MNGIQAPPGFDFGMPATSYSAPPTLPDYGLNSMSAYGAGNNGMTFNNTGGWGQPTGGGGTSAPPGGFMSGFGDWFKNSGLLDSSTQDPVTGAVTKNQGFGAPVLGAASGLLNAFMGMKQYGLAKDSLAQGQRQFNLNYDAQRTTTNTELQDRQRARVASNPGAYQSVGDYMAANGIKGG